MPPPMEFTVDRLLWEINLNWAPSRHISTEKHDALKTMVDSLLELGVIQPAKATAWSQVHLVRKPNNGGWRFTTDYRSLNKVISNGGWQIPNIKETSSGKYHVSTTTTRRTTAIKWIIDPDSAPFNLKLNFGREAESLQYNN